MTLNKDKHFIRIIQNLNLEMSVNLYLCCVIFNVKKIILSDILKTQHCLLLDHITKLHVHCKGLHYWVLETWRDGDCLVSVHKSSYCKNSKYSYRRNINNYNQLESKC